MKKNTKGYVALEVRYEELCQYKVKSGHCNVPQSYGVLGKWVDNVSSKC